MPHFVIECSNPVLENQPAEAIIQEVHEVADSADLLKSGDIKVRIKAYSLHTVGETNADFVHVFGHITEGRTTEQKKILSERIIRRLKALLPEVPII